jgi:serine/threonine protein kinase
VNIAVKWTTHPSMSTVTVTLGGSRTIEIPFAFGKYQYVKTIGSGAFSAVILVQHRQQNELYACKVVPRAFLVEENLFERFEQEVRLLPSLNHPHIVRCEEIVFEPDLIYVIMEYCANGDLFSSIATSGLLHEGRAQELFRQVAEAVEYIHNRDIAHRDLKPENILLDQNWVAKLADFGLCHSTSSKKLLSTPCGSPFYAPPEIIANREYDGKMADIWSLGVCLYTAVTGVLPWTDDNQVELFRQIREADIEIPAYLSASLRSLLSSMLQRNPLQRPTIQAILDSVWLTLRDTVALNSRTSGLVKARSLVVRRGAPPLDLIGSGPRSSMIKRVLVKPKRTEPSNLDPATAQPQRPVLALMRQVPPARPSGGGRSQSPRKP